MIVTIEGVGYTVPKPVGRLVNEAKAYRRLVGGRTPEELDKWMDDVIEMQELIKSKQAKLEKMLNATKEAINKR